MQGLF